jgi:hypothetical protein
MLTIKSRADKILQGEKAGLYHLQVPMDQQIRTGEVRPGRVIVDNTGGLFEVREVALFHILMDPPIPVINLLVEEADAPEDA